MFASRRSTYGKTAHDRACSTRGERQCFLDVTGRGQHDMMIDVAAAAYGRSRPCLAQGPRRELRAAFDAHRASCELDEVAGFTRSSPNSPAPCTRFARADSRSTSHAEHDR